MHGRPFIGLIYLSSSKDTHRGERLALPLTSSHLSSLSPPSSPSFPWVSRRCTAWPPDPRISLSLPPCLPQPLGLCLSLFVSLSLSLALSRSSSDSFYLSPALPLSLYIQYMCAVYAHIHSVYIHILYILPGLLLPLILCHSPSLLLAGQPLWEAIFSIFGHL